MSKALLPPGSTQLEKAASDATVIISEIHVPLRTLWDPWKCPLPLLPWLAWTFSVDRWDNNWPEETKRQVIAGSYRIHRLKGTTAALRQVVEPFGFLLRVIEWWQSGEQPGTFRLEISIMDQGITEETYHELERLIDDVKPVSRHLTGLSLSLQTQGYPGTGAGCYMGDVLTIYPWFPETLSIGGTGCTGSAVHLIDTMEIASVD
ncbi:TPA: phage tail protein I [Escherichia coli]|nr:phage tail protein I [Escherichia coli]HBA9519646.1 phage tail protein I [Escherichia coli]HBA9548885.1 phage tail protein I [Escherichia coli]HBA9557024.1 phage tail protein I [Escherichia coli]